MSTVVSTVETKSNQVPQLTMEHKNKVLMIQRQILNNQLQISRMTKANENMSTMLTSYLTQVAKEIGVDLETQQFDLDSLSITVKGK